VTPRRIPDALVITRSDIARVMSTADFLAAVEQAFRAAAAGEAHAPPPMHIPAQRGGFHAKGASLSLDGAYAAVKVNGNFPGNPAELGLPTVQGAIVLCDGDNGTLLAILDSTEVTLRRTAAASALAAKLLASPGSRTLLICGCGEQGRAHAEALRAVLPIDRVLLWDRDPDRAEGLALALAGDGVAATAAGDLASAALGADVIASCTPSLEPYLDAGMVAPGAFIAAVGAAPPGKSEIAPRLMAAAAVVTDVRAQCAAMGDLHHAIAAGTMTEAAVRADLGEVLTGASPGRATPGEIVIFDSTGTGTQDVAAAAAIYQRCARRGLGQPIAFAQA
jgi:ornithine cyclodeaminase/alanine dehydrogenase-like protein (mu-crystallin family)